MDSTDSELALDLSPMMRIYKDGRVERLMGTETVPPSFDPKTNVESKDIVYSLEHHLSVRLYLPNKTKNFPFLSTSMVEASCLEAPSLLASITTSTL